MSPTSPPMLPSPPDGGWGWVIVAICFFYQALVDGSFSVIAVFMPHFLSHFDAGNGRTALVGSVFMASMLVSGPVVSFLTHLFGCRVVAMVGGFLLSLGFCLATLAPTVDILVVTLGFIGGFGLGMLYLPSVVMCGNYFERKRALAMGITASGAGIGMLVFALLSNVLLTLYDWKNALRLLTCITLQSIIGGALLRPLTSKPQTINSEDTDSTAIESDEIQNTLVAPSLVLSSPDELRKFVLVNSAKMQSASKSASPHESQESLDKHLEATSHVTGNENCSSTHNIHKCLENEKLKSYSAHENLLSRTYGNLHTVNIPNKQVTERICYSFDDVRKSSEKQSAKMGLDEKTTERVSTTQRDHFLFKPLLRKDVFYSGSLARLPEYRSQPRIYQANVIDDKEARKLTEISSNETLCLCITHQHLYVLRKMLDISLVTDGYFIVICLSNMSMQMGYFIPIMFITEYAEHIHISAGMAATLISLFGVSNTLGRLCGGAVANLSCVNSVHVAALSMIMSGVCSALCVFCTKYAVLACCVAALGCCVAPIIPLTNVFLVDYLGLDRLTSSVGLMSLAKGVASLFGAPLAGYLLDETRSFSACFFLSGALFAASGALLYLLPVITKYRNRGSVVT